MKRIRHIFRLVLHGEKGQSVVEFAIILPLILLIATAAIDCGWCIYQRITLESAADGLCKSISRTISESQMKDYVRENYPTLNLGDLNINASINISRVDYTEYSYRSDVDSHWKVPMYYDRERTTLTLTYKVHYLTPWGKFIFGTPGNYKKLQTTSVAVHVLDNEVG